MYHLANERLRATSYQLYTLKRTKLKQNLKTTHICIMLYRKAIKVLKHTSKFEYLHVYILYL